MGEYNKQWNGWTTGMSFLTSIAFCAYRFPILLVLIDNLLAENVI